MVHSLLASFIFKIQDDHMEQRPISERAHGLGCQYKGHGEQRRRDLWQGRGEWATPLFGFKVLEYPSLGFLKGEQK